MASTVFEKEPRKLYKNSLCSLVFWDRLIKLEVGESLY
jgi:hypothetical protein